MDAGVGVHACGARSAWGGKELYAGLHDPPASDKRTKLTTTGKMNDVQFGDGFVFTHCVGRNV